MKFLDLNFIQEIHGLEQYCWTLVAYRDHPTSLKNTDAWILSWGFCRIGQIWMWTDYLENYSLMSCDHDIMLLFKWEICSKDQNHWD